MSAHTPGPWVATPFTTYANNADGKESGWHINQAGGPGFVMTAPCYSHRAKECEANARLIAAAPDLLEIAQESAGACAECDGTGRTGHARDCASWLPLETIACTCTEAFDCPDCAHIRAAIAKATGAA